jgi:uncharacterized membrane protein YuzA (DUF378 family)
MNKGGDKIMNIIQKSALVLTIIGAINWGLIGLFSFDLVAAIFGSMTVWSRVIYTIVGVAGIVNIMLLFVDLDEAK